MFDVVFNESKQKFSNEQMSKENVLIQPLSHFCHISDIDCN